MGMSSQSRAPDREPRFTSLFEATYADLLRFAQRRVHSDHAEDVVAESFLVAWRRLDDLPRRRGDARAWLFGIARGVILNAHRGAERQRALAVRLVDVPIGSMPGFDADLVVRQIDVSRAWFAASMSTCPEFAAAESDRLRHTWGGIVPSDCPLDWFAAALTWRWPRRDTEEVCAVQQPAGSAARRPGPAAASTLIR
jgi:DNA-directed RNA polymerase specialized sigma24 family protein